MCISHPDFNSTNFYTAYVQHFVLERQSAYLSQNTHTQRGGATLTLWCRLMRGERNVKVKVFGQLFTRFWVDGAENRRQTAVWGDKLQSEETNCSLRRQTTVWGWWVLKQHFYCFTARVSESVCLCGLTRKEMLKWSRHFDSSVDAKSWLAE